MHLRLPSEAPYTGQSLTDSWTGLQPEERPAIVEQVQLEYSGFLHRCNNRYACSDKMEALNPLKEADFSMPRALCQSMQGFFWVCLL